jgi:ComF family protein
VARSIALLKYHGQPPQARALADLARPVLAPLLSPGEPPDAIIPLPLSPQRLAERGFNQAALLARALFNSRPDLIDEKLLIRTSDGRPQATLSRDDRRKAIRGCFTAPAPETVRGARLMLFDDVLTTGATAGEAAQTLLTAGAARVDLVTIARTVLRSWQ